MTEPYKLSEIIKLQSSEIKSAYHGVCYDTNITNFPDEIDEISFLAQYADDEKTEFDRTFMGKVVNWSLFRKAKLIIELHPDHNMNATKVVQFTSSVGADLSMLPPLDPTKEQEDRYINFMCELIPCALAIPCRDNNIYPFSGFMEFLVYRLLTKKEALTPDDMYINDTFISTMSQDFVLRLKASMEKAVYDCFEGRDNFERSIVTCVSAITDDVVSMIKKESCE